MGELDVAAAGEIPNHDDGGHGGAEREQAPAEQAAELRAPAAPCPHVSPQGKPS
jgi:hypothetical protein